MSVIPPDDVSGDLTPNNRDVRPVKYTILRSCVEEVWVKNFAHDELQLYRNCILCYDTVYASVERHEFVIRHDAYDEAGCRLSEEVFALHVRKNIDSAIGLMAFYSVYELCCDSVERNIPVWTYVPTIVQYLHWKNYFLKGLNDDGSTKAG
jgi:hypothetical protein